MTDLYTQEISVAPPAQGFGTESRRAWGGGAAEQVGETANQGRIEKETMGNLCRQESLGEPVYKVTEQRWKGLKMIQCSFVNLDLFPSPSLRFWFNSVLSTPSAGVSVPACLPEHRRRQNGALQSSRTHTVTVNVNVLSSLYHLAVNRKPVSSTI